VEFASEPRGPVTSAQAASFEDSFIAHSKRRCWTVCLPDFGRALRSERRPKPDHVALRYAEPMETWLLLVLLALAGICDLGTAAGSRF